MKKIILGVFIALLMTCTAQAQMVIPSIGPTTSPLDMRTKINTALDAVRSNFSEISNNTIDLTAQSPLVFDPNTGVISLSEEAGMDFSLETDPASPEDGSIWWNETTKQLKVADVLGIYTFNATSLTAWDTTPSAFSFADVVNATTNSMYSSNVVTVSGINHPAAISVSGDASAKYSVNNATAVSTNGTVESGDEVRAVVTSSASDATAVNATVVIGGVSDAFVVTTTAAGGVGDVKYVGWAMDGDKPSGTPAASSSISADGIGATKWTAIESGTATGVQVYMAGVSTNSVICSDVVLYKNISGTITLIGRGAKTFASNAWSGFVSLSAVSGQSLAFSQNDELYFGVAISSNDVSNIGRNDSGGTGNNYVFLSNFSSPPETVTLTLSTGRLNAMVLAYE